MSRKTISFDLNWKFKLGDWLEASSPDFCDKEWRQLDLPHDWSIEGKFDQKNLTGGDGAYLPAGIGWYRKHFEKSKAPVTLLEFDGVMQKSDVWLNGVHLGHQNYGYIGFEYDLTPYLVDGDNVLAVKVDNSEQPNSRWYTGSGIYRHVWLTQAEKVRVAHWGVFVSTPSITEDQAQVKVQVELTKTAEITLAIISNGNILIKQDYQTVTKKQEHTLLLDKPILWSCDNPVIYTLRTQVVENGIVVDEVSTPFGVRSICFDKDNGFSINGIHTKLNGVCIHHDGGSVGAAVPDVVWARRLKTLKEMGCNAIRMSHNPPSSELLDMCDQMGFLVMDEAFDEWVIIKRKSEHDKVSYGYGQFFEEDSEKDLLSMVCRDRNHPSIVIWSIGNEIPDQASPEGWKTAQRLQDLCHLEDPTRLVTSACDNIKSDNNRTTDDFIKTLDVLGVNYVNRWRNHAETGYAWERHKYPNKIIIGTEHSSIGGIRGEYNLESVPGKWWAMPYNSRMIRAEHLLKQTMANDYICGDFMWTGIDYLGEARWPNKNSASGVIDMCGFPKDGYYLYQSQWTKEPMIHLFPHWNWEGFEGTVLPVICYTNCDTVELIVNGRSFGKKCYEFPMQGMTERYMHFEKPHIPVTTNDLHLSWDVPYEPGAIKAIGRDRQGNILVIEEIRTTGIPSAVELKIDKTAFSGAGEVAHCIIRIVDGEGNLVPNASDEVTITVEGSAHLIGFDNSLPKDLTSMKAPVRRVAAGLALALIKTKEDEGEVTITVIAPGLQSTRIRCRIGSE